MATEVEARTARRGAVGTFIVVSVALFMTTLDNLVVSTALPNIRKSLDASLSELQWTVNAYTVSFAVLLLLGAALGDRLGRKRIFVAGLVVFTAASAVAAVSTSIELLIASRAVQGFGAAMVTPLTLTLLASVLPADRRGIAIGAWSAIGGLGVAFGPVVGGALVNSAAWNWIFWINVPVGVALIPLALWLLRESHGPSDRLDIVGVLLSGVGLLGIVVGLVRTDDLGWTAPETFGEFAVGFVALVAFVRWEQRTKHPMMPMKFFRRRSFDGVIAVNVIMFFGVFGSVFLLSQYFQTAQGLSPLQAGLRVLPWTVMPLFVAPVAGALSERIGPRPFFVAGLGLQGLGLLWIATHADVATPYTTLVPAFVLAGIGMGLVFAPAATAVLASVSAAEAGQASGAMNALREVGGVFGVAVLASVFAGHGGYTSPQTFVDGMTPAVYVGAAVVLVGAVLAAALVPGASRTRFDSAAVAV